MVQHSCPYMTTVKTIALTLCTFAHKATSLLFNMLSSFVIAFLLRSNCLNFMTAVTVHSDLEPKKIKSVTVSIASPSVCHEMIELDAIILDLF